ncbi:MAG TPA: DUF4395 domain-containing protein [Candidatus Limnocylindria bacterium]|nr:DUF4395 domain-containing protein [Candidatus Limnocylindria bacterium]
MYVDPRGPRFAAAVTTVVLAAALLLAGTTLGLLLLAGQAVVFAIGAVRGPQASPYGLAFKRFIRPRLSPPVELEDARPPRFAQAVGLGFALTGLLAFVAGATVLGTAAVALALGAAFLNAAFGFCLGCEVYLLVRRVAPARAAAS